IPAVQIAGELEPPVPAAGRLQQIAAERAHRPKLRRRGERTGFSERLGNLGIDLELGQGRSGADPRSVDPARYDLAKLDERLGTDDPVTEERHELRPAGQRHGAVAERRRSGFGGLRPEQLQPAPYRAHARAPLSARSTFPRA